MNGNIILNREMLNHWTYTHDMEFFRAWVSLIFLVNYSVGKAIKGHSIIEVDVGSIFTSERILIEKLGLTRKRLKRFLNLLQSDNMIEIESSKKGTKITIVNYENFTN